MKLLIALYRRLRAWSRAEYIAHLKHELEQAERATGKERMRAQEKMDYPALPAMQPGKVGYLVRDKSKTVVMYQGNDEDIARLVYNSSNHDTRLVPAGETMEKMP